MTTESKKDPYDAPCEVFLVVKVRDFEFDFKES